MRNVLAMAMAAITVGLGVSGTCHAQSLNSSGSSFVGPMMTKWAKDYERAKNVKINYSPIGSGAGIRQFLASETDFGCSDVHLNAEQIGKAQAAGETAVHIPLVLGGVAPLTICRM